jgi:hypothetical protein
MGEPIDIIFILGIPALIVFLVVWLYLGIRWIIDMYRWKKERRKNKGLSKER